MKFSELLRGVEVLSAVGDAEISSVEYDSRRIQSGALFVAMRGEVTDGNRYIDRAIQAGAIAIVSDSKEKPRTRSAWAAVTHGRRALAGISANYFAHPERILKINGVTGTNGKTTTCFFLDRLLQVAGKETALIGTIEYRIAGERFEALHTTPESLDLYRIFDKAMGRRVTEVSMEVSSHALEQGRVYRVPFEVAIFTNITQDHLDYHKTMENYFSAKASLFDGYNGQVPRVAVINSDDKYGRKLTELSRQAGSEVLTYGLLSGDFHGSSIQATRNGISFALHTPAGEVTVSSSLTGEINIYNLLAASAAAFARGLSLATIRSGISRIEAIPGRFERVDCGQPYTVVVDYAHTDDALRNLTKIARSAIPPGKRVITVFGCGGDRDRKKRPLMGKAAGEGSDFVVLTSDNPRNEDPMAIIGEAKVGLQATGTRFAIDPDRSIAVQLAISEAKPGDIVLIAGKGHEKTQTIGKRTIPFDDVEVAGQVLESLGYSKGNTRKARS